MTIFHSRIFASLLVFSATVSIAAAGEADVVDAKILRASDGTYRFDITVLHADEGWDHYANAFEIVDEEGRVLGVRTLLHPHTDEQPFTRSLSGVVIPEGLSRVKVRAKDSVHGTGGRELVLSVPKN